MASLPLEHEHEGVGSVVMAHGLHCGLWDLPRLGIELLSPALAGGSLTTRPLGNPRLLFNCLVI